MSGYYAYGWVGNDIVELNLYCDDYMFWSVDENVAIVTTFDDGKFFPLFSERQCKYFLGWTRKQRRRRAKHYFEDRCEKLGLTAHKGWMIGGLGSDIINKLTDGKPEVVLKHRLEPSSKSVEDKFSSMVIKEQSGKRG